MHLNNPVNQYRRKSHKKPNVDTIKIEAAQTDSTNDNKDPQAELRSGSFVTVPGLERRRRKIATAETRNDAAPTIDTNGQMSCVRGGPIRVTAEAKARGSA